MSVSLKAIGVCVAREIEPMASPVFSVAWRGEQSIDERLVGVLPVVGEERVMAEIAKGAPWARPMCLVTGVVDALRELGARKLVVGTPYLDEINTAEAEFLAAKGFDLLDIQGLNLETGIEFGRVTLDYWKRFALEIDRPDADAIFLSCGGIRALEVVEEIERVAGKPVVTSNQGQMWSCLRRAGIGDEIEGFGRLFSRPGTSLLPGG